MILGVIHSKQTKRDQKKAQKKAQKRAAEGMDDDEDDEVNVSVQSRGQEGGMLAGGSVPEDYSKFSWKGISGGDANVGLEENCVESNRKVLGRAGQNASTSEYGQRGIERGRKRKTAFDSYSGPAISDGTFHADPLCSCSCFPSVLSCFPLFPPLRFGPFPIVCCIVHSLLYSVSLLCYLLHSV